MGTKNIRVTRFTVEQIIELRSSPYVAEATGCFVFFTSEFKQRFYDELMRGKKPRKIVAGMGIDPDILGTNRLSGIRRRVLEEAEAGHGFSDFAGRGLLGEPPAVSPEDRIKWLEHELAYTKQELDFVKKIIAAAEKAQD